MLRFVTFLALSLCTFLTPASGEPRRVTGERDGITFDYTAELRPNEDVRLRGVYSDTREKFSLTVNRRGWVDGEVGGWPVAFRVDQERRDRLVASLRADDAVAVAQATDR